MTPWFSDRSGAKTDIDHHSVIDLTTVGRVSGRPHTIEIWFYQPESTIYMLAGGGTRADWVRNLVRTPAVMIRAGDDTLVGDARLVTDPVEERFARDSVYQKYAAHHGGDLTSWREQALPIAVDIESR